MKPKLTKLAKNLRKESTDAEKRLWSKLCNRGFGGHKFRRQQPVGKSIVGFVCFEKMLALELDGSQHGMDEQKSKDSKRDAWMWENGYQVLRFSNNDVKSNIDGVLKKQKRQDPSFPSGRQNVRQCATPCHSGPSRT